MNRMLPMNLVLTLAAAGPLLGCREVGDLRDRPVFVEADRPLPADPTDKTDVIIQTTTPKVDVLYTIDNSCSMSNEQLQLRNNFRSFISYFIDSGLDYHVAVTSTDLDNNDDGDRGKLVCDRGVGCYVDDETPNPLQDFSLKANLGISGSATERGLDAIYGALETRRGTPQQQGYYRDEAAIHTIIVSDEPNNVINDNRRVTVNEFTRWYQGLKRSIDDLSFSAIVDLSWGTDYITVANRLRDPVFSVAEPNWDTVLDQLGVQASGLRREYFLSERPVAGTVSVAVDQFNEKTGQYNTIQFQLAPEGYDPEKSKEDPTTLYQYSADRNSINFLAYLPTPLSRVNITYRLLTAAQSEDDVADDETDSGDGTDGGETKETVE